MNRHMALQEPSAEVFTRRLLRAHSLDPPPRKRATEPSVGAWRELLEREKTVNHKWHLAHESKLGQPLPVPPVQRNQLKLSEWCRGMSRDGSWSSVLCDPEAALALRALRRRVQQLKQVDREPEPSQFAHRVMNTRKPKVGKLHPSRQMSLDHPLWNSYIASQDPRARPPPPHMPPSLGHMAPKAATRWRDQPVTAQGGWTGLWNMGFEIATGENKSEGVNFDFEGHTNGGPTREQVVKSIRNAKVRFEMQLTSRPERPMTAAKSRKPAMQPSRPESAPVKKSSRSNSVASSGGAEKPPLS